MNRRDDRPGSGGRRPLLVTFVGNNRQMLNEIRDSLNHLRKNEIEGYSDFPHLSLRPDLSQSGSVGVNLRHEFSQCSVGANLRSDFSPSSVGANLGDKCAGSKMTRRDNQHHKALEEIRISLRPYQNVSNGPGSIVGGGGGSVGSGSSNCSSSGGGSDSSSTVSSTSSQTTSDSESNVSKVKQIMQYGFDEDIAVRALSLSRSQSVNDALQLLLYIVERIEGSMKGTVSGLASLSQNQRPNFGSSSPVTSETNSLRSDSPALISIQSQQLLSNDMQAPPPLPPRAPISAPLNHFIHSQVPPSSADGSGGMKLGNGVIEQHVSGQSSALLQVPLNQVKGPSQGMNVGLAQGMLLAHSQNNVVPQGHVQQLIKRMSPGQAYHHHMQQQQQQGHPPAQANGGVATVAPQRGLTSAPVKATHQIPHHHHPLVIDNNVGSMTGNVKPVGQTPAVADIAPTMAHVQAPPPPYSQARTQVATVTGLVGGTAGDFSHQELPQQQDALHVSVALDKSVIGLREAAHIKPKIVASTAVSATRMTMGLHMPVIMPSVHSKEVTKPVPQTATAPVGPPPQTKTLSGGIPTPMGLPTQHKIPNGGANHIGHVKNHISNSLSPLPNQQKLKLQQQAAVIGHLPGAVPHQRDLPGAVPHQRDLPGAVPHQKDLPGAVPHQRDLPGAVPHQRDLQIPVTHSHNHHQLHHDVQIIRNNAGSNYPVDQPIIVSSSQLSGLTSHQQGSPLSHNHMQAYMLHNTSVYQYFSPDLSVPAPHSDPPSSRTTNQSPMSVLSTISSPSTYSDMPSRLPPPYPGHGVMNLGMGQPLHANPPQLPPRVPLKEKLPFSDLEYASPLNIKAQTANFPPSYTLATSSALSSSSSSPSPNPSVPMTLSASQNICGLSNGNVPVHQIDICNAQMGVNHSVIIGTASPDEKDSEISSLSQGHNTGSAKCSSSSSSQEKHRCLSPLPERKSEARARDRLRCDTMVKVYSPQAFKFYMEQHVENVLKCHTQRISRRMQLEKEMAKVNLSEEAALQMRRMLHQKESNYIRLKRAKMNSSMFEKIQTLGIGAFGEVALVRKKDVGYLYAMKTLTKSNVIKRNQVAHVKAERDILAEADNEWVVKLYYSFQDKDNLYFVMDYVPGGDLMGLLIRKEILEEHLAQFYIAELVLAIESVHKMGFIHRDIKPDNILIDKDGHIKLTDFGLCTGFRWTHNSKYYQKDGMHSRQDSMDISSQLDNQNQEEILKPLEQRRQREQKRSLAHSLVGTPNYIAPEVLLRLGYTKACDWWSVGVILYEMVIGQPPFYAPTPAETQYKVINWKDTLKLPHCVNISQATADLIIQLLQGPETRLGINGATEVKEHQFFAGINFEGLRRQPAPLKPTIRHLTDTSNFDPVDPDKLRTNDSEGTKKLDSKLENGKHPEHAFFEFTFRRFFDDSGHPCSVPSQQDLEFNSPVYV